MPELHETWQSLDPRDVEMIEGHEMPREVKIVDRLERDTGVYFTVENVRTGREFTIHEDAFVNRGHKGWKRVKDAEGNDD